MKKTVILTAFLAALLAAGYYFFPRADGGRGVEYRFAKVERGSVVKAVSASGELNAVVTVQVGSQISGRIMELAADFNSPVRADQVIARIDPRSFEARVNQARADLALARAGALISEAAVVRAGADVENATAVLGESSADIKRAEVAVADAKRDRGRSLDLKKRGVIAQSQVDKALAAYDTARAQAVASRARYAAQKSTVAARKAQILMAEADVEHARAQVQKSEAGLELASVDLENTFIRSPVNGIIIDRNVDVGQTVAASLQAPILFSIAQDLRRMQVETNIDEADIGQIHAGQRATFSVDAFPGREFVGTVSQVRKAPQTVQNVVTYTVVISADNADQRLLPGMTANVQVVVGERADVVKIPNAALRFQPADAPTPQTENAVPAARTRGGGKARAAERLARLTERLGLDDSQQEQVQALMDATRNRIRALRQGGATGDELRATVKTLRDQQTTKLVALFNEDQREKFRQMQSSRAANPITRGRVWVRDARSVKAVDVSVGFGDGSFTELVRGDIKEGVEVAIGVKRSSSGSPGRIPRFGF